MKQQQTITADSIIEAVSWLAKELSDRPAGIPMNKPEYWGLVGMAFMDFFSCNLNGESDKYTWETRIVDDLRNLWIWRKA